MRRDGVMFFLGVVLAAAMLPATVVAAVSLIRIQGQSGNVAQVDAAKQLMVAESDPAAFRTVGLGVDSDDGCIVIDSRPATKALIVRQVRVTVVSSPAFDLSHFLMVFPNKTCTGTPLLFFQPWHLGTNSETFEPGVPVKASSGVSVRLFGSGLSASVQIYGYTVPPAAVP